MHPLFYSRHTTAWEKDITERQLSLTDKGREGQGLADFPGWLGT